MNNHGTTVISLGGSLIVPDTIDVPFVKKFVACIRRHVSAGRRFIIVTGGGATARIYMRALDELGDYSSEAKDELGIRATRINAHMVKTMFEEYAYPYVLDTFEDVASIAEPVIIAGGGAPGQSSDACAVALAHASGASEVINMSNITHVYSADPSEDANAHKHATLSWDDYLTLIPSEWTPGLSTPFDPVASRKAKEYGVRVIVAGGDIANLEQYFATQTIEGTIIS